MQKPRTPCPQAGDTPFHAAIEANNLCLAGDADQESDAEDEAVNEWFWGRIREEVDEECYPYYPDHDAADAILCVCNRAGHSILSLAIARGWAFVPRLLRTVCINADATEKVLTSTEPAATLAALRCAWPSVARYFPAGAGAARSAVRSGCRPPDKAARPPLPTVLELAIQAGPEVLRRVLCAAYRSWTPHRSALRCAARGAHAGALAALLREAEKGGDGPDAADGGHKAALVKAGAPATEDPERSEAASAELAAAQAAAAEAEASAEQIGQFLEQAASGSDEAAGLAAALADAQAAAAAAQATAAPLREARASADIRLSQRAFSAALDAAPLCLVALAGSEDLMETPPPSSVTWVDRGVSGPCPKLRTRGVECARLLLAAGAAVSVNGAAGRSPLHWAARSGNLELMRALLEAAPRGGADLIQSTDSGGRSPLHEAVLSGAAGRLRRARRRMKLQGPAQTNPCVVAPLNPVLGSPTQGGRPQCACCLQACCTSRRRGRRRRPPQRTLSAARCSPPEL